MCGGDLRLGKGCWLNPSSGAGPFPPPGGGGGWEGEGEVVIKDPPPDAKPSPQRAGGVPGHPHPRGVHQGPVLCGVCGHEAAHLSCRSDQRYGAGVLVGAVGCFELEVTIGI